MIDATVLERWGHWLDDVADGLESAGDDSDPEDGDGEDYVRNVAACTKRLRVTIREMKAEAIALARVEARTTEPA